MPDAGRRDLLLLLIASAACIVTLALGFDDAAATGGLAATLRNGALIVMLALAAGAGLAFNARAQKTARERIAHAGAEVVDLRRRLIAAEAVVKAEPQVLIFWEQGRGLKIVAQIGRAHV